jgi:DNA primase
MDTTSKWFDYLHNTRMLSDEVIREAQLGEDLGRLRIPIFDMYGNELYAKLRRPHDSEVGPKYIYETGATAALYGTNFSDLGGPNIYVEGEMDALAMRTLGLNAFSSTGGAMTFKAEWLGMVAPDRANVICFDNDETGIKGAIKLAKLLQVGSYTWVPPMYGKDISDLVMAVGITKAREIITDPERQVPFDLRAKNTAEFKQVVQKLGNYAHHMEVSIGQKFLLQLAFDYRMEHKPRQKAPRHPNVENAVQNAKAYPIENLLPFRQRKHKCLWHNEKTASLHLYKDNHVFCHGSCNRQFDAIDVYMKLNPGVTFIQAVEALNHLP